MDNQLPLSKDKQIGRQCRKVSKKEKDEAAKLLCAMIYVASKHIYDVMETVSECDLDHIKNKGSHGELRYTPGNWQLLNRFEHSKKTESGLYKDFRSPSLANIMKKFDILF